MELKTKRRGDDGFTLIELMVVVLVIAILLAIAIPTFLGARKRAQDSVAKTTLRNALSAANVMYTDAQTFAAADNSATGLITVEPALTYVATATTSGGPKSVSVSPTATVWAGATLSDSGTCFTIKTDSTSGQVSFAKFTPSAGTVRNGTNAATSPAGATATW